jgi:WXG100 family type VII secretion target
MSATVTRTSAAVRSEHQSLHASLAPLFGTEWSGAAAAQFSALYEDFDRHARGMSDALDGIGRLLASAGNRYAEVESAIAASFR